MSRGAKILIVSFSLIIIAAVIFGICSYVPDYITESDSFSVSSLIVNYSDEPVVSGGNDLTFGWMIDSETNGFMQSAYRIVVNDSDSFGGRTYWDSGKIISSESACVPYSGRKLVPGKNYFWKVTVWDSNDEYKTSDQSGKFMTGSDEDALKKASFISVGMNKLRFVDYSIDLDAAITEQALGLLVDVRNSAEYLLWQFNIVDHGVLYLRKHVFTGGGYTVEEVDISEKCGSPVSYGDKFHVRITSDGKEIVTYVNSNKIDTFKRNQNSAGAYGIRQGAGEAGWIDNVHVELKQKNGEQITKDLSFDDGENPFSAGKIEGGRLIAGPYTYEVKSFVSIDGSPISTEESGGIMFRREFSLDDSFDVRNVKSAWIYATALGNFNVYLNGDNVGNDVLKPGWTDYTKRIQYFTYDVTGMLKNGVNTLYAVVTSGWWNGKISFGTYGYQGNAFLMSLVIEYRNGRKTEIVTDNSWESNRTDCPVIDASIYGGETYDARLSLDSCLPEKYDPKKWGPVELFDGFHGEITPASGPAIKVRDKYERKPESVTIYKDVIDNDTNYGKINVIRSITDGAEFTLNAGETAVVDLGQNMVGWPEIIVSGSRGTEITMNFGEMLNDSGRASRGNDGPEGSVYKANYRSAQSVNRYIMSGEGEETYHTEYSFYGFRYISITVSGTVTFRSIRGQVVGSDNIDTGFIETSDDTVNQLISNIRWSMMGNYLSVPTDCPQRDERLGWTGDTQVFAGTGSYFADTASFFRKWLLDCIDSQVDDGSYPDVIPRSNATGSGAAAWGDAGIIVPYVMYKKYSDTYVIRRNYDSMEKYMKYIIANGGPLERYGDWLAYQPTEQRLICKAYYAYDALLMAEMSDALGFAAKANYYREIYESVKSDYIKTYFNDFGFIPDSQTSVIVTLLADLVPDDDSRREVLSQLVRSIDRNGGKLQTGFVGTANIVNILSLFGEDETAYTLLLQRGNPSWLYSIDQGATTTWERWDSYTLQRGFGDVGMNSFNHYAYGCVGEWMFAYMAGINGYGERGFKDFVLSPRIDPHLRIDSVSASYNSVYGTIRSSWKVSAGNSFEYEFAIPANTRCTVKIPLNIGDNTFSFISAGDNKYDISGLNPGDKIIDGLTFSETQNGCIIIEAVSGNYRTVLG